MLAALKSGTRAQPATLAAWQAVHAQFAESVASYQRDQDRLRDVDGLLARLWALGDVLAGPGVLDPREGAMRLLSVLGELGDSIERAQRIELRLREAQQVFTPKEIEAFLNRVVDLARKFIPAGEFTQFIELLRAVPGDVSHGKYELEDPTEAR